jgi:hypothetical protein
MVRVWSIEQLLKECWSLPDRMSDPAGLQQASEQVPTWFEPFMNAPDPETFDALFQGSGAGPGVDAALGDLALSAVTSVSDGMPSYPANGYMSGVEAARRHLAGWTGEAAEAFQSNFLDPFEAINSNQVQLVTVLSCALRTERAIWLATRRDILQIADLTVSALEQYKQERDNVSRAVMLTTLACLATLPVSVATLPAVTSWMAASTVWLLAADAPQGGAGNAQIGGDSTPSIIASTRAAIADLTLAVQNQQEQVAAGLMSAVAALDADVNADGETAIGHPSHPLKYVFPRPNLVGMDATTLTSPAGMGAAPR